MSKNNGKNLKPEENKRRLLDKLIREWESEVVEFKHAKRDFSPEKLGKYFSALANEANLRKLKRAWLVFGVNDKTREVVGSNFRPEASRLQVTKEQVHQGTDPNSAFRNIGIVAHPQGRVVLFEIPSAPQGMPIAWKGHYYGRDGERLVPLGLDKLDEIRNQASALEWAAHIVPEAKHEHLDDDALQKARESFSSKGNRRFKAGEIAKWSTQTFLARTKLTRDGKLTRAALLLLGKEETTHLLAPHPAQMVWKLIGLENAYEHFGPPFLLNTTALYQKIRNTRLRILPEDTLMQTEITKYDPKIVMEALHNCIAHQDYTHNAQIIVTEYPGKLIFENEGDFFEGKPEDYVTGNKVPRRHRNSFLNSAMKELNMIDTVGYGIYRMHRAQAERYLPMPDYDLSDPSAVKMTIYGSTVDPAYSRLLIEKGGLELEKVLALDRVQKRLPIPPEMTKALRREGLIEGRKPNLHISAAVAQTTGAKAKYIRTRAQNDAFYTKLITDYIQKFGKASRRDINDLLSGKLSEALNDEQKERKIGNLLTKMRRNGQIQNLGARRTPEWHLVKGALQNEKNLQKKGRASKKKKDGRTRQ